MPLLYDSGGLHDLNSMVPKGTPTLAAAVAINDNGSIVCTGNDLEVFLLKPLAK